MIRTIQGANTAPKSQQANVEQTHALGAMYVANGYSPQQVMDHLKSIEPVPYVIEGFHYKATYVANYVAGARAVVALVTTGLATITKAKGLHIK